MGININVGGEIETSDADAPADDASSNPVMSFLDCLTALSVTGKLDVKFSGRNGTSLNGTISIDFGMTDNDGDKTNETENR